MVLVASSLRDDTDRQMAQKQQVVNALSPATFKGMSRGSIARSLHPDRATDNDLIERIRAMGHRLGYEAFVSQSALRRAGVPVDRIACPVLVAASTHDTLRPKEESEALANAIPGATIQWFEHSGHMVPLEQPRALAESIVGWLDAQRR